jgi:hypothetical protein
MELDSLHCAHQFNGQNILQISQNSCTFEQRDRGHRQVILLIRGGGDAIYTPRVAVNLVLGGQGGRD